MKLWQIRYWTIGETRGPVAKWLDKLPKDHLKSVAKEISILEETGNNLKLPHSKALSKGLFELRERQYGYRIYYCFKGEMIIILLAAGDKKSQEKDIKTARERLLT
ncbi:MAG: type II toxin-antitoxin system RelE/ParE family toxin [Candidatus Babeliales bacterium]